jgi:hypothetical protein
VAVDSNTNNQCQTAVGPLSICDVVRGSTVTATNNDVGLCGTPGIHIAGVWYAFMGKCQGVTAFTCSAFADAIASRLSVFAGNCDDLTCIEIRSGGCDRQSWITCLERGRPIVSYFCQRNRRIKRWELSTIFPMTQTPPLLRSRRKGSRCLRVHEFFFHHFTVFRSI